MNGFVPEPKTKSYKRSFATSIAGGACLFVGFIVGTQVPTSSANQNQIKSSVSVELASKTSESTKSKFLETQTIDFTKISWISDEFAGKKLKLAENLTTSNKDELNVTLTFSSFELPKEKLVKVKKFQKQKFLVKRKSNFKTLAAALRKKKIVEEVIVVVRETPVNEHADFQAAMSEMKTKFFSAVYIEPLTFAEQANFEPTPTAPMVESIPAKKVQRLLTSVKKTHQIKKSRVNTKINPVEVEMDAEVTAVNYPAPQVTNRTSNLVIQPAPVSIQTTQSSAEINTAPLESAPQATKENKEEISNGEQLSPEDKESLSNALLSEQLKNINALRPPQKIAQKISNRPPPIYKDNNVPDAEPIPEPTPTPIVRIGDCEILANHKFSKPGGTENSQICPQRKEWISKESIGLSQDTGWVKLETDNSFTTLTRHPAANGGGTLLLDPNSVAILGIKAGVQIAKGTGIVVALVPAGYKVEFLGRSEEAEFFELSEKKYVAFLNAEPGSGVVEVTSEKDQNNTSTVFAPVLQDTITYLDLAKPEQRNIYVQVFKNGKDPDSEVAGLTVSVSTHLGIQAITQVQGNAALRAVNIVPGFPVFVDVSSKFGNEQSFTYRYELKYKNSNGVYFVNQVPDNNISKWIKQIPSGISDQSAMILGSVNPKLLNGFKTYYYPKVTPLSEKFGLEPMSFSILWDGKISGTEPLEGDKPRFMAVQVPEGIAQVKLMNEFNQEIYSNVIPVSPRVINVISE